LLFNVVHFPQPIPPWFSRLPCHIFISIFILWPHFHFSVSLSTDVCLVTFVALDNIANNFLFYVDYFLDTLHRHLRFTWRGPHLPLQPFLLTSFSFVPLPSRAHHILMWKGFGGIVFWLFQHPVLQLLGLFYVSNYSREICSSWFYGRQRAGTGVFAPRIQNGVSIPAAAVS